jgi:hypothetical protein
MASHPKDRIRWGVLVFYVVALAYCIACWVGIAWFLGDMAGRLP